MPESVSRQAELHAATCFLNSVFREWTGYRLLREPNRIEVPLEGEDKARVLVLMLSHASVVGKHRYTGVWFVETRGTGAPGTSGLSDAHPRERLGFERLVALICAHLAHRDGTPRERLSEFRARVEASRAVVERSLTERPDALDAGQGQADSNWDFIRAEQAMLVGHPFHPAPKSRGEFSAEDLARYSPELAGRFKLAWLSADPAIVGRRDSGTVEAPDSGAWLEELAALELGPDRLPSDRSRVLLPAHPWQLEKWKQHPVLKSYFESGKLVHVGESLEQWSATSSLRTLYREGAPWMLKFSMSVSLTNSVRHLLEREVERGPQLAEVLETPRAREWQAAHPEFRVLREPGYLYLKDAGGKALPESIVVFRENPYRSPSASRGQWVLAALVQDAAEGERPLLLEWMDRATSSGSRRERALRWLDAYLHHVVRPLVVAHADYGFVLGAHQQNLVLSLDGEGFPIGATFRDCQGSGYTEAGFAAYAGEVPSLDRANGNVLRPEMANALFGYYVILNSTFGVVTALAADGRVSESELLDRVRKLLLALRASQPRDPACLDYLLESERLWHKGNFRCVFAAINENTTEDPMAIYVRVENPLRAAAPGLPLWTETQGRRHPARPPAIAAATLYERQVPELGKTLSFRLPDPERDLERFHRWHHVPRVADLWELALPPAALREYLERALRDPHATPLVFEIDGEAVGYFEVYWAAEDRLGPYYDADPYDRGFHLLIGEETALGVASTGAAIRSILHYLYGDDPRTQRVVAEPRADNRRVLKYVQLTPGWRIEREFDFPHKRSALLVNEREAFFAGGGVRVESRAPAEAGV